VRSSDAVIASRLPARALLVAAIAVLTAGACLPGSPAPGDGDAPAFSSIGPTSTVLVVRVVDGDTIQIEADGERHTVRYIGIDAPELARDGQPAEPLAAEATEANADLVAGRRVVLERDRSELDRFGRLLRYVWLADGGGWRLINEELVRAGLAEARSYAPDTARQNRLDGAESSARDAGRGLWAAP